MRSSTAFTLAELLIALAILGVIATFTIPKVLTSQANGRYNAVAKEAVSMISGAFETYKREHTLTNTMTAADLTPYMNYVRLESSTTQMDAAQGYGVNTCGGPWNCLRLHNGALLGFHSGEPISCTNADCAVYFHVDADGAAGNNKSVSFFVYTTGRITSWGNLLEDTKNNGGSYDAEPSADPPWFSWN